jgi:hypothetical protein
MQAISFSLFGSAPLYVQGAVQNAIRYPKLLPDWKCIFFCASDVPKEIVLKLKQAGAEIREGPKEIGNRMFDRFCILDDPKVQRALFRDTDSRPSQREVLAVQEWMKSTKPFHSMADHIHHSLPLGGGLFGYDRTKLQPEPHLLSHVTDAIVKSRLAKRPYKRETSYSLDQTFLTHYIWPLAKKHGVLRHDSCTRERFRDAVPWPGRTGFEDLSFVGEIIDASEQPNWTHRFQRLNHLRA